MLYPLKPRCVLSLYLRLSRAQLVNLIARRHFNNRPKLGHVEASAMFKKAVRDHKGPTKPLQTTISHLNASHSTFFSSALTGTKRKLEMASRTSNLGSLHNAVYFDENDFDDDNEIDLEAPDVLFLHTAPCSTVKPSSTNIVPNGRSTVSNAKQYPLAVSQTDIKYPELPTLDFTDKSTIPTPASSVPYPWSSSPPSHTLPPAKPRSLPWLINETEKKQELPIVKSPSVPITPAPKRPTDPWNKTYSAVKEEQKEHRRQYRKKAQDSGMPHLHRPRERVASLFLSNEQQGVLEAVVEKGKSIFFTGSAGTGKSVLMREIIKKLREKYRREPDRVAVTASTGLAACNIEGVTLHSFAGIGLGKEEVPELVKKV